ncbi:MAG TPA: crossover junction endodeoxyribonuclease RuvC [Candidatus Paceibacterota bacterium]|nr:crossover junction endodeoxyribonuclease RuvC [Candidatus Paceibacterota bacterium]
MKVLGIDPGYDRLGLAVLSGGVAKQTHKHSECFTPEKGAFDDRLRAAGEHFAMMLREYDPDAVALETLFVTKNQKTAMHVAEMRGVLIYEARRANIPVYEYAPSQVKLAVAGYGKSDKAGVASMLQRILTLPKRLMLDDEYDAIAVAMTHLVCNKQQTTDNKQ